MPTQKKEQRFTQEQRRQLAVLHDDIDAWVGELYANLSNSVVADLTPEENDPHEESSSKPKKPRLVFSIDRALFPPMVEMVEHFLARMMSITENVTVRSVTNKLPHLIEEADLVTISASNSFKHSLRAISSVERQFAILEEKENPEGDDLEKKEILAGVLEWMRSHDREAVEVWFRSDRVTFNAYDRQNRALALSEFFRGGVIVPHGCEVRLPQRRKPRSDKIDPHLIKRLTENYYFVLKP